MVISSESDPFVPQYFANLTVTELIAESVSTERIYPKWWSLVYFTLRKMTHSWPMNAFRLEEKRDKNNYWSSEALHDFTSEIVCNELLKNLQQDYIVGLVQSKSGDPEKHMGLVVDFLKQQINKVLDHRRAPTLTGNIMLRLSPIFEEIKLFITPKTAILTLTDAEIEDQVALVASQLSLLPRFPNSGEERLSRLYETEDLEKFALGLTPYSSTLSMEIVRAGIERSLDGMSGSISALEKVYRAVSLDEHFVKTEEDENGSSETSDLLSRSYKEVETTTVEDEGENLGGARIREGKTYLQSVPLYSKADMIQIDGIISTLSLREIKYLVMKSDPDAKWSQTQMAEALGLPSRKKINDFQENLLGRLTNILQENKVEPHNQDYIIAGVLLALGANGPIEMVSTNE
jgi:hypothetical protein